MAKNDLDSDDLNYIDDIKQALLEEKSRSLGYVVIGITTLTLCLIIWASLAIVDEMTIAEGVIIPSTKIKKVQSLEGGIVSQVLVQEGEFVEKGQTLLRLDDVQFKSTYLEEQARYFPILTKIARLRAEISDSDRITWPKEINAAHRDLIEREQKLFQTRRQAFKESIKSLENSYALANKEFEITKPLVKQGVMSEIELLQLQRNIIQLKSQIDDKRVGYFQDAQTQLNDSQADAMRIKESLVSYKDRFNRTTIVSPVKGTIQKIYINTEREVIKPGDDIIDIIPIEDHLLVQAKISPQDIGFIHPNQEATVKITAYDFSVYGGLKGHIQLISADTQADPKGESYYKVLIRTDDNSLLYGNKELPIIAGMTVSVHILTGRKSVLSYLLKPILKTRQNAFRER